MQLPLDLLVARICTTDDAHLAVATNHLAVLAHALDRRSNLHRNAFIGIGSFNFFWLNE